MVVLIKDKLSADRLPAAAAWQHVLLCVDTFYVLLFQAFELSVTSKRSMKVPVTFLTFPNQMILCPCDWVGDRDTMNKLAGLLSEQRPGHIVCARFQTQEAVHMRLPLNVLRCLDKQPVSSRKQTTHNYPVQPQHHFVQVGDPKDSVSVATLLPGDSSGGPGWCLRNDRDGQR